MSTVLTLQSEEVMDLIKGNNHPELYELVGTGYEGASAPKEEWEKNTIEEFDYPGRASAYFYLDSENQKIVGSLCAIKWMNSVDDKRGSRLRDSLERNFGVIPEDKCLGYDVGGVIVNPDYRGKGVVGELYKASVEDLNPLMIVGQTRNPSAISARSKYLKALGYETFFGGVCIGNDSISYAAMATIFTLMYYETKEVKQSTAWMFQDIFTHQYDPHLISMDLVDLTRVKDERVLKVFKAINAKQKENHERGIQKVVYAPLIAVRESFIKAFIEN